MAWIQRGVVFEPDAQAPWSRSHAQAPSAIGMGERVRIYYATRDTGNRSRASFIEVASADPTKLLYVHDRPVLDLGKPGTHDEDGVVPSHVMAVGGDLWMYYGGVSRGGSVPYRMSIGLARSADGGLTFTRMFEGPVVDRTPDEPYMTMAPMVLREDGGWTMWYGSGIKWTHVEGKPEPVYVIMAAHSDDGVRWRRDGKPCLRQDGPEEASTRPAVLKTPQGYEMWFCHRASQGYRDGAGSYRIGLATSADGQAWERVEGDMGLAPTGAGWNARTMSYPSVLMADGRKVMFHNGDGFGRTGIGCATWSDGDK